MTLESITTLATPCRFTFPDLTSLKESKALILPIFRFRLPEIPSIAHRDSALIFRSNLCDSLSSSCQILSLQSSNFKNPSSRLLTIALSIQKVCFVRLFKKVRS